jgi:hypothetical protein
MGNHDLYSDHGAPFGFSLKSSGGFSFRDPSSLTDQISPRCYSVRIRSKTCGETPSHNPALNNATAAPTYSAFCQPI